MNAPNKRPVPSDSSFDTRDEIPSMGDPEFVDGQIRALFDEAKQIMFERESPAGAVPALIDKWAATFSPDNSAYVQTLSPQHLDAFLRARGLGANDDPADLLAPIKALLVTILDRFVTAAMAYHEEKIDGEALQFEIDTAAEDFTFLIRGMDNGAD